MKVHGHSNYSGLGYFIALRTRFELPSPLLFLPIYLMHVQLFFFQPSEPKELLLCNVMGVGKH